MLISESWVVMWLGFFLNESKMNHFVCETTVSFREGICADCDRRPVQLNQTAEAAPFTHFK